MTATGTGQARVSPKNRHDNASIVAAYDAARHAAIAGAISQAHEYALDYAKAVGLTLGPVSSVSDAQSNFYGPGQFFGPFGT
ncbi:MAG: SIMPL domain-containing protein, partial [Solirubrobacteraceae bacterium]